MRYIFVLLFPLWLSAFDLMSEENPPYNFSDAGGKPSGMVVEVVREILKEVKHVDNIKILPWSRSYKMIQEKPNKALFAMSRLEKREKLFKWVGPVASSNMVLYAKKDSNITINSLSDIKQMNLKIGTYNNDAGDIYFREKGFESVESVHDDNLNIKKLLKGRIDLWSVGEVQGIAKAKKINLAGKIKKVFTIRSSDLYIAFSKETKTSEILKWQDALFMLQKNGKYQEILDKYYK